ncbi:MAG: HAMP domain-containing sensor histidine kinase [Bacteroidota bacterium]
MKLSVLFNRFLNLGASHARDEQDIRLIRQCNFTCGLTLLFVVPLIFSFSDIGNGQLFNIIMATMLVAFLFCFFLNVNGYNQAAALLMIFVTMTLSSIAVLNSNVQIGAPLTNLIIASGANYLLKNNKVKMFISLLAVAVFFFLGYYQYKYLPFDEREYILSFIILIFLFLLTRYAIKQDNAYQKNIEVQNQKIMSQRDHLKELNRTKNRFFSIISHDLRGPINALLGLNKLMTHHVKSNYDAEDDQELAEIQDHLRNSARQVTTLLDNLMQWALKEEGVMNFKFESISIYDCIKENIEILQPQANSKGIRLILESTTDRQVLADRNSLLTIIRNVTSNALKFTPDNGSVTFSVEDDGNYVVLKVADTGVGIAPDIIGKLFHMNEEKVTRGTRGEAGTGLGLSLVHDLLTLNKGKVEVISEVNKGTTFSVSLAYA